MVVVVATAVATVVVVWELSGWASGSYTRQRGTLVETRFGGRGNFMMKMWPATPYTGTSAAIAEERVRA